MSAGLIQYRIMTNKQTDGQSDGYLATAYSALCIELRGSKPMTSLQMSRPIYTTNIWSRLYTRLENGGSI